MYTRNDSWTYPPKHRRHAVSSQRTVLVVEDDPDLRDAVELILARRGYNVIATGDGLRAVELAGQSGADVALVDLLLPGQSGFQVTTDLKAHLGDSVRVIVMSGAASAAHQDYALASGAERFLPKPFTSAQLLEAVAEFCPPPAEPPGGPRRIVRIG